MIKDNDEFDEDHSLDMVINSMLDDLMKEENVDTVEELITILEKEEINKNNMNMNKLYDGLNPNNKAHKVIIEINKRNEEKYGVYHNECGMFERYCSCTKTPKNSKDSK